MSGKEKVLIKERKRKKKQHGGLGAWLNSLGSLSGYREATQLLMSNDTMKAVIQKDQLNNRKPNRLKGEMKVGVQLQHLQGNTASLIPLLLTIQIEKNQSSVSPNKNNREDDETIPT